MGRDFDGVDDFIDSASNVLDPNATSFTAACWFRPDDVTTVVMLSQLNGAGTGRTWLEISATSKLQSFIAGAATAGATTLVAGTLYHGAITHDGGGGSGTLRVYLDGAEDGSAVRDPESATGVSRMGIAKDGVSAPFNGPIAEMAIWNAALTADEVNALAKGCRTNLIRSTSLKGYWPMLGDATELDFSGNGNNGTLTGTTVADHAPVHPPFG